MVRLRSRRRCCVSSTIQCSRRVWDETLAGWSRRAMPGRSSETGWTACTGSCWARSLMNADVRRAVELTVLIPSSRPLAAIAPTLDALAVQSLSADRYEVIVVVDGPDNGRAAGLKERRDPYPLIVVRGPGVGRA